MNNTIDPMNIQNSRELESSSFLTCGIFLNRMAKMKMEKMTKLVNFLVMKKALSHAKEFLEKSKDSRFLLSLKLYTSPQDD